MAAAADAHLGLLRAMVAAQQQGEEAVQAVVEAALREISGCTIERIVYSPAGVVLKDEFAAQSAIAVGERLAIVGRWGGTGGDDSGLW